MSGVEPLKDDDPEQLPKESNSVRTLRKKGTKGVFVCLHSEKFKINRNGNSILSENM